MIYIQQLGESTIAVTLGGGYTKIRERDVFPSIRSTRGHGVSPMLASSLRVHPVEKVNSNAQSVLHKRRHAVTSFLRALFWVMGIF